MRKARDRSKCEAGMTSAIAVFDQCFAFSFASRPRCIQPGVVREFAKGHSVSAIVPIPWTDWFRPHLRVAENLDRLPNFWVAPGSLSSYFYTPGRIEDSLWSFHVAWGPQSQPQYDSPTASGSGHWLLDSSRWTLRHPGPRASRGFHL